MLTKINYEVKGQLAKLLATEDLIIENRRVETAMFDVERRVLTLPMWEKASASVYDLLVGHEVGHALYTPVDNWKKDYPDLPMSYVNILEDVRIEKLMKRKYAGIVKTFFNGYKELSSQDFFELEENDVEEMGLPDRLNLNAKIGNFVDVPFSDGENYFINKANKTETFQEVLDLSIELFDYMKEQIKDSMASNGGELDEEWKVGNDFSVGESSEGIPFQETESDQDGDSEETKGQSKESQSTPDLGSDFDTEDMEAASDITGGEHGGLETITDKTLSDNLENLNNKDRPSSRDPEYCTIPELKLDNLHIKVNDIHSTLDDWYTEQQRRYDLSRIEMPGRSERNVYQEVDNEYRLFRRSAQKEVNYLVKEFECRKSADAYARATVSKTGVLDCTKLHSYKYNEDLFKKITTLPDGKNHGLIFVLDWSGSMSTVLMDTIKQLFNLVWFCKKVQIPFQVFAFTNEWNHYSEWDDDYSWRSRPQMPLHHEEADNRVKVGSEFSMVEILTSDCKKSELENQMINIWRISYALCQSWRWDSHVYYQAPRRLSLSGTPLNEALVTLNQLIPQFKKSTGVQKVQCVTLTDGEAHPLSYNKFFKSQTGDASMDYMGSRSTMNGTVFIRDRHNGKTYSCKSHSHELTSALLDQLRGRFPDVNFIGIRVMDGRDANSFIRRYLNYDVEKVQHVQASWKRDKSLKLTDVGYHAYFGLSSHALGNDTEFTVKEDATKSQIKSAFKKSLNNKKMNKKVLSQFMEFIA